MTVRVQRRRAMAVGRFVHPTIDTSDELGKPAFFLMNLTRHQTFV